MKYPKTFLKKIKSRISFDHKKLIAEEKGITIRTINYVLNGDVEDKNDIIKRSIELIKEDETIVNSITETLK